MTKEELAALITGCRRGKELTHELSQKARKNKLVVLFGGSDDLMLFSGAIDDEVGCYDGGRSYVTNDGDCIPDDEWEDGDAGVAIDAIWHDTGDFRWTYKTKIPHVTFEVNGKEGLYCRGIIFSLNDVNE